MPTNADPSCIFCKIIAGDIPSYKVLETDHTIAFLDINPVSVGHTQIIPKYHAKTLIDLPDAHLADIGPLLKKVALMTGAVEYNVLQNNGAMAFQHVPHVHFHVIPKTRKDDGLVLDIDANWPMRQPAKEELAETLEMMKARA
ncbi:HIT-like protein [Leucogyrophana mollusca]|uniref:HIT-like protein n=1 Tax=Leucogyrophana mollusca TaxID=85980 RepID=A0ACB8B385_9AGAM|nr:HIT-like protein [Leucogyrophana mollusca]